MLTFINVKYVNCKHIKTIVANPKDWDEQEIRDIRDGDGQKLMTVYLNYCLCPSCAKKD